MNFSGVSLSSIRFLSRFRPVGDSLLHRCIEDTELDGYMIKKDSLVQASLLSVMHNPIDFPQPEVFKPERFLVNGQFQEKFDHHFKKPQTRPFKIKTIRTSSW